MDPVTHALTGLAVAGFSGAPFSLLHPAYLSSLLGSLAPDLDIVLQAKGHLAYLRHHRGPSHALPGLLLIAVLLTAVLRLFHPYFPTRTVFAWSLAGALSHSGLDVLNSCGARVFWPFSRRRVGLGLLTLCDPLFIALLGLAVGGPVYLYRVQVSFFGLRPPLHLLFDAPVFFYLAARWLILWRLRAFLARSFLGQGVRRILVFPALTSIVGWSFLVETAAEYLVGDVWPGAAAPRLRRRLPKPAATPLLRRALASNLGRLFSEFTPLCFAFSQHKEGGSIVRFFDLRYFVRDRFLHSATLVFDADERPREAVFQPYSRDHHIRVAL